jgi:macrolide transport system ATP-binding/permease protein
MNEKIGIIGENGSGKTSLMKLIAHQLTPTKGTIQTSIDFQYYAQMNDVVEESITDLDGALLSRFTVPTTDVQNLSGGEMTKYRLTQLLSTYQSGMLLDEPTTHLDQRGKQQLIEELRYYYGTLLFISHDRFFLNELAEKIWEIKDGKITEYKGNYDAYLQQKEHEKISIKKKCND